MPLYIPRAEIGYLGGAVPVLVVDSHGPVGDWAELAADEKARGGFVPVVQRAG